MSVAECVADVRSRVSDACGRTGRDPAQVRIVAATKGASASQVLQAVEAGISDVGENRVQELREKRQQLPAQVRWHFLGSVQTNKVRHLDGVWLVHGVDRMQEADALQARAERTGETRDVLIEVNVGGESSKQGIGPRELEPFVRSLSHRTSLRVRGLMIMAPRAEKPEDVRWVFADARRLRDRVRESAGGLEELSMGMTDDFEVAVEEGATIVRIGRAIFREE
ncbi:MAG TPA: YggS family pyridoxal phosphate-dependent enzyme [Actinomycetota bacterium]|nr:YggS family pyridoxal phosphate-dependent enzyme [Actinomycetota bacterium]